ncbi:FMN adenylyltransferase [Formivibrio citricus]|uniref:Riboflavin biosynthesis protein n=1 Tax=Formivibrio citricus TaxID=83765 RepID=A0A1I4V960_9NEIS|nr:bifunctional riboflavin kinase/FAD synthetase [Formivibrio citricus]SFM97540.1 FMN adenylyltransferase [Formivibrio citricus]
MRVIRGLFAASLPPCALTIGNFDGLHCGHAAILAELKSVAATRSLCTAVLTFEPHPREFFAKENAPTRLSSLREKLEYLQAAGIDYVIVQPFNTRFAGLNAHTFRDEILGQRLAARYVLVGDDFRFGAGRSGDFSLLAQSPVFETQHLPTIAHEGLRVSSTAVRAALAEGKLKLATQLLGRPYSISGRVVQGQQIGHRLGFPTANIQLKHNRPPLSGIFVAEVHGLGQPLPAVANLGRRPTLENPDALPVLEVHIFDFDQNIYRRHLRVDFLHKLRDEAKFPDLDSLKAQIALDCNNARAWHAARA